MYNCNTICINNFIMANAKFVYLICYEISLAEFVRLLNLYNIDIYGCLGTILFF